MVTHLADLNGDGLPFLFALTLAAGVAVVFFAAGVVMLARFRDPRPRTVGWRLIGFGLLSLILIPLAAVFAHHIIVRKT